MAKSPHLSSRDLIARIGLDAPNPLLDEADLDLEGDVAAALRERFAKFQEHHAFQPGDLVTWKPGLKNRRFPAYGQPAVVMQVLDPPLYDSENDSGDTYFREPLDLILGLFLPEGPHRGDFLTWHFDGRRFQPQKETH